MKQLLVWVGLAIGVVVGGGVSSVLWHEHQRTAFSESDWEEALLAQGELFQLLKLHFPSEFDRLLADIIALAKSRTSTSQVRIFAQERLSELRQHYATLVPFVSDASLKRWIVALRDFHKLVLEKQGPRVCNNFAMNGAAAVSSSASLYLDQMGEQGLIFFQAIADAIEHPGIDTGNATDGDWQALFVAMERAGVEPRYLDVLAEIEIVAARSPDNPDICPALMVFMDMLVAMPGDQGRRLRSTFVQGAAAS